MERVKRELSREPLGWKSFWLFPALGSVMLIVGLISFFASLADGGEASFTWLMQATVGVVFVFLGTAELLPPSRRKLSTILRVIYVFMATIFFVVAVLALIV